MPRWENTPPQTQSRQSDKARPLAEVPVVCQCIRTGDNRMTSTTCQAAHPLARHTRTLIAGLLTFAAVPGAWAQLMIGQTSGFTGPVASGVKENTDGAKLYIDHINAQGGANGQRIELISLDDKFAPKLAAE